MAYFDPDEMDEADDPDREWYPRWFSESRGFVDRRADEEEVFQDILDLHLPDVVSDWKYEDDRWLFGFEGELMISVSKDSVVATSSCIGRKALDHIRAELRSRLQHKSYPVSSTMELAVYLLQIIEEGAATFQSWRQEVHMQRNVWNQSSMQEQADAKKAWTPLTTYSQRLEAQRQQSKIRNVSVMWNRAEAKVEDLFGLELSTNRDTTTLLLGKSIRDICLDIPDWLKILHIEPVFRVDLAKRFLDRQKLMEEQVSGLSYSQLRHCVSHDKIPLNSPDDNVAGLAKQLCQPHVTFHGSPRRNTRSIIRYGFVKPGDTIGNTRNQLEVRCGSTYGKGIYSSPDPMYASAYAQGVSGDGVTPGDVVRPEDMPGRQLFVCATLMGRAIEANISIARGKSNISDKFAHSQVSPNELQYVVFNAEQILPCYILHLDYGAPKARQEFKKIAQNPRAYFDIRKKAPRGAKTGSGSEAAFPGEIQAKKEALKAAAGKWFPYGYGPAQGQSFVIEEIGHVSDDEEDYGEYQDLRNEHGDEIRRIDLSNRNWFDEYQTVRKSDRELSLK